MISNAPHQKCLAGRSVSREVIEVVEAGVEGEETSTRIEDTNAEILIRANKDFLPSNTSHKPRTIPRTNTPVTIKILSNKAAVNAVVVAHEFKVVGTRGTTMVKATISEAVEDVDKVNTEIASHVNPSFLF